MRLLLPMLLIAMLVVPSVAAAQSSTSVMVSGPGVPALAQSSALPYVDEDDPKRDHSSSAVPWTRSKGPPTTNIKLSYRYFRAENLDGSALPFHVAQLDVYPLSRKWVRIGIETQVGFAHGALGDKPSSVWFLATGLSTGFQYPGRVTPFVDLRLAAGFIGGDVVDQSALSYCWMVGLEAGAEVFAVGRLHFTVALGWLHPWYHGIDYVFHQKNPNTAPPYLNIGNDSFTVKVGIGL